MTDATVTITQDEYNKLRRASLQLRALEASGVDNWDWYGAAYQSYMKAAVKAGLMDASELDEDEDEEEDE